MNQDVPDQRDTPASPMRHACCFHETVEQQLMVALPFIEEGLQQGEHCIVVAAAKPDRRWSNELRRLGSAERAATKGVLSFWTSSEWQAPGEFSSMRMARHTWQIIERSLQGYPGLRVAADMRWTHEAGVPADRLCHWEATLEYLLSPNLPVQMLCQYDMRLPGATLHAALRTHAVVLAPAARTNPNFEAQAILEHEPDLNQCSTDSEMVGRMLGDLIKSA